MNKQILKLYLRLNRLFDTAKDERGASTVEYALILIAAATFAGILIAVIKSDTVHQMIEGIIKKAFSVAGD